MGDDNAPWWAPFGPQGGDGTPWWAPFGNQGGGSGASWHAPFGPQASSSSGGGDEGSKPNPYDPTHDASKGDEEHYRERDRTWDPTVDSSKPGPGEDDYNVVTGSASKRLQAKIEAEEARREAAGAGGYVNQWGEVVYPRERLDDQDHTRRSYPGGSWRESLPMGARRRAKAKRASQARAWANKQERDEVAEVARERTVRAPWGSGIKARDARRGGWREGEVTIQRRPGEHTREWRSRVREQRAKVEHEVQATGAYYRADANASPVSESQSFYRAFMNAWKERRGG